MAEKPHVGTDETVYDSDLPFDLTLFNTERISREEAIQRYMTSLPTRQQDRTVPLGRERIFSMVATGDTLVYRPTSPYMNHQLREAYDVDHLLRIGREIQQFGQLQDCGVAVFTGRQALEMYIRDSNDFYGTDVKAKDIPEHRLGGHLVTIYGHNRQLGSAAINLEQTGNPDRGILLRARLYKDISFRDFLRMQAIENTGQAPPAWNRARSIARYFELSLRDNQPPTWSELAEYYGISEDQVWRALNYAKLPPTVQHLVEEEKLPFSGAIELTRLEGIYAVQDIIDLAHTFVHNGLSSTKIQQEVSKRVVVKGLPPEIQALVENSQISNTEAEQIKDMCLYGASEAEITNLIAWILTESPRLHEVREFVSKWKKHVRDGQLNMFSDGLSSDEQVAEAERARTNTTQLMIGRAITDIVRQIAGVKTMLETGIAGGAVTSKPIGATLHKLNGYFDKSLTDLAGITTVSQQDLDALKGAVERLNGNLNPGTRKNVEKLVAQLEELLELEASTSTEDQAARIETIRQRITQTGSIALESTLF